MTTPKKPLTKNESAIQLGNVLKYGAGSRGGASGGIIKNLKKLLKIGKKPSKVSKSTKVTEVQTRPKQSLQNQKVNKSAKVKDLKTLEKKHPEAAMNKRIPAGTIAQGGTKNLRNTGSKSDPEAKSSAYKLRLYKKEGAWKKEHVRKKGTTKINKGKK